MQKFQQHATNEQAAKKKKTRSSPRKAQLLRALTIAGMILLLLIPTYFAIGAYFVVKNAPDDTAQTYYTALEITGPTGTEFHVSANAEEGSEEEALFRCFTAMLTNAVISPDIKATHTTSYQVSLHSNTGIEQYTFFFAPDDLNAYYTDSSGVSRRAPEGSAEYFLNSPFSFELYPQATPPVLITGSTDRVIPSQLSWRYQTQNGLFSDLIYLDTTDQIIPYPIRDNAIEFEFQDALTEEPISPTECTLTIHRNGERIHTGDSVSSIYLGTLKDDEMLDFEITAKYTNNSLSYRGEVVYRFRMFSAAPTTFAIEKAEQIREGEFFLLSCQNVQNEQNLEITSADGRLSPPVIFKRNDIVYALIPAEKAGPLNLLVEYGSTRVSFDLTVLPDSASTKHTLSTAQLRGDWSAALNGLLKGRIEAMGATGDCAEQDRAVLTLRGSFGTPNGTKALSFGDTVAFNQATPNASLPFELYTNTSKVSALAWGRVLRVGSDDLLGNFVILDHGCGLYTWYCGLALSYVQAGQDVAEGQAIGKAGQSGLGFSDTDSVMILATTGKVAIDPAYLRSYQFHIGLQPGA